MGMSEAAVQREQREATVTDRPARPRRMIGGIPLSYLAIGAGLIGGFLLYRRSKLAGATTGGGTGPQAFPASTATVPTGGYGSANPPVPGSIDWGSVLSQMGTIGGAAGGGGGGGIQGVITNPPQVAYGAADPTHPIPGLLDELTGVKRWVSKPGGSNIPGGPSGYGAAGGENNPNVYTTTEGTKYSELPGGTAFESTLASCQPVFWQPNPGTFVRYPTKPAGGGGGCKRAPGAPAYGTPVFVQGG